MPHIKTIIAQGMSACYCYREGIMHECTIHKLSWYIRWAAYKRQIQGTR